MAIIDEFICASKANKNRGIAWVRGVTSGTSINNEFLRGALAETLFACEKPKHPRPWPWRGFLMIRWGPGRLEFHDDV